MKQLFPMIMSALLSSSAFAAPMHFYLGTYTAHSTSHGIYQGTLDLETGKLGPLTLAADAPDPNFLALSPDAQFLYAALGPAKHDALAAYAIEKGGLLRELGREPSQGAGVCYVSLDGTGHYLFAANYSSGNISWFRIMPGGTVSPALGTIAFHGSGPNPKRQKGPYAHSIYASPGNAFVYACDLGSDRVWIFHFHADTGTLAPAAPPYASVPPGAGARHLAFGQNGRFVYVANELDGTVTVFARDTATGALKPLETVSSLPPGTPLDGITSAEIALHPSGRWLYVSNRGCDTMAVFNIDPIGRITLVQTVPAGVKVPRHFAIDPTGRWMITAGQEDNRIAVLKIDPDTGQLSATDQSAAVGAPVCVLFNPQAP